jgi:hypothetical protein
MATGTGETTAGKSFCVSGTGGEQRVTDRQHADMTWLVRIEPSGRVVARETSDESISLVYPTDDLDRANRAQSAPQSPA